MVNIKETIIEITVIAVGVLAALYLMNYMGYIQHNSGGIKNKYVIPDIKITGNTPKVESTRMLAMSPVRWGY